MHLISVSEIIIPESRQRKNFPLEKSEELKTSIRTKGQNPGVQLCLYLIWKFH